MPRALVATMEPPSLRRAGGGTHGLVFTRELLRAGWTVTGFNELVDPPDLPDIQALGQLGVPVYAGRWCQGFSDAYLEFPDDVIVRSDFDLAVLQSWLLGERFIGRLRELSPRTKIIVDMGDLFLLRLVRSRFATTSDTNELSLLDGVEFVRELNAYAAADAVLAVSDKERMLVDLLCGRHGLAFRFPLSRPVRDHVPPRSERRGLLFVGAFNHPPNAEAVRFLCEDVLPHVPMPLRSRHPLRVVGYRLGAELATELVEFPHVLPVGWVPDLAPYVDSARVFVAPLLSGAGVKNKFLEAFAGGLPVVTTTLGIEGMDLSPGEHVAVADDPVEIAREITRLLEVDEAWDQLSESGRRWTAREHPAESTSAAFWAAVDSLVPRYDPPA